MLRNYLRHLLQEVYPITRVSGQEIGKGIVGNLTRQLHKLHWEKHSDDSWSTSIPIYYRIISSYNIND